MKFPTIEALKDMTIGALIDLYESIFCICGNPDIMRLKNAIIDALENRDAKAMKAYKYDCYVCEFDEPYPEIREYFTV